MTQAVRTEERVYPVVERTGPSYQAYQILRFVFTVAPIVAGLDKFFHVLVNWDQYLAALVPQLTHIAPHTFMLGVGVIEIIAGLIVAFKPKVGSVIVAIWLAGIIINLLLVPGYFDIALRDFGLCLAAIALNRLSMLYDLPRIK